MKGFARKNQLIITGLAIMIAVAGYLHFTSENGEELSKAENDNEWVEDAHAVLLTDDDDSIETMSETTDKTDTEKDSSSNKDKKKTKKEKEGQDQAENDLNKENISGEDEFADISAEDLGADDIIVADAESKAEDENTAADSKNKVTAESAKEAGSSIGEAVLVNNTITGDYFSSAKLSREQARAKNEETLMGIVNSTKMEEIQKQEAVNNLIHLTEISEMETAAETLLGAKGFQNAIVTMTDDSVDVVVDAEGLTKQQMVQIQDIVKRKTKVSAENIVITPVAVEK